MMQDPGGSNQANSYTNMKLGVEICLDWKSIWMFLRYQESNRRNQNET